MRFLPAVLLAAGLAAAVPAQDRIYLSQGAPIANVEVLDESHRGVSYRRGNQAPRTVPLDLVVDVVRADTPPVLREGRSKAQAQALRDAEGLLQLALAEAQKPWVKEYAAFYLGEVQRQLAKYEQAVKSYELVLQTKPDSRFLPQVRLSVARAHAAREKYDEALAALEAFRKEVDVLKLPRSAGLEAQRQLGSVHLKRGNFAEAARQFDGVATEARNLLGRAPDEEKAALRRIELMAVRDRATALIGDKNFSAAEAALAPLQNANDDLGRAIHLIGQAEILAGRGESDRARVLLSQAVVTSPAARTELPRALLLLGRCYLDLRDKGERGAAKMASIYLANVVQRFAGTDEAKAAEALQRSL